MIVPAILTQDKSKLIKMISSCREFTDFVQIDIMDGKFVSSKSVTIDELKGLDPKLRSEAHLMVNEPLQWIKVFKDFGSERIIFHYEIDSNKEEIIDQIRSQGLGVGMAVNPDTEIERFKELVDKVDMILFMSVIPGFYGAEFIPQVLEKVKQFRRLYPLKPTGIDGGIKITNVGDAKAAGIELICVGSAILSAVSPKDAYQMFLAQNPV